MHARGRHYCPAEGTSAGQYGRPTTAISQVQGVALSSVMCVWLPGFFRRSSWLLSYMKTRNVRAPASVHPGLYMLSIRTGIDGIQSAVQSDVGITAVNKRLGRHRPTKDGGRVAHWGVYREMESRSTAARCTVDDRCSSRDLVDTSSIAPLAPSLLQATYEVCT